MPNITTVNLTSGVPTGPAGAATVSTLDALMADGGQATLGAIADAAVAAGAAGTINAHLRAISRDIASGITLQAGANVIGSVNQGTSPWVISGSVTISGTVAVTQSGAWTVAATQSG